MLLSFVDISINHIPQRSVKSTAQTKAMLQFSSIKQMFPWGWPQKEVTTTCWDVKINTARSAASSKFAASAG